VRGADVALFEMVNGRVRRAIETLDDVLGIGGCPRSC